MIEETMRVWSGPIASALAVISIIYTWLTARSKANEGKINSHERKLTEHDRRIQALENELRHLPSKDSVHNLQVDLTEMKGQITAMVKSSEATERALRRVEEFLLNRAN